MKTAVLLDGVPSSLVVICGRFGRSIFFMFKEEDRPRKWMEELPYKFW